MTTEEPATETEPSPREFARRLYLEHMARHAQGATTRRVATEPEEEA
ncbi:hypothetical protein OG594_02660 [Streptomyces sp. NBC_01214]|nr:hypothetical protein [Streptomyces sp. NBC_01214]MCX4800583.1 hypothetical protein [Streptomyces sp. NBC_01214]